MTDDKSLDQPAKKRPRRPAPTPDELRSLEDTAFPEPFRKLMRQLFWPLNQMRRRKR